MPYRAIDIRLIITAYRTEKVSDDHPYNADSARLSILVLGPGLGAQIDQLCALVACPSAQFGELRMLWCITQPASAAQHWVWAISSGVGSVITAARDRQEPAAPFLSFAFQAIFRICLGRRVYQHDRARLFTHERQPHTWLDEDPKDGCESDERQRCHADRTDHRSHRE